ncbi:MAG TPA: ThuA domain-containing protein [Vicinamibacterales bacterium]|nr:ThuA domain-containing protein [Vicinamibacterales bacterium]
MQWRNSVVAATAAVCAATLVAVAGPMGGVLQGQAPQGRGGGGRGNSGPVFFTAVDTNKDAAVTKDEMKGAFDKWYTDWDTAKSNALTGEQLMAGLASVLPTPPAPAGGQRGAAPQNQTPNPDDVKAMLAALPATAPAKPKQPRKVLVLGKAAGFVHSSIPLAARTVEEMGKKTGAWSTTITYDPADINEANLKQYDAIFLASTTGAFLDDPNDAAATAARRKALLDFVRGGKGLAGIHAATDSYHQNRPDPTAAAGRAGRGGGGRGNFGQAFTIAPQFVAQGDKNADQKLSREEFTSLSDTWFDKMDTAKVGRITEAEFPQKFAAVFPPPAPPAPPQAGRRGNGQAPATQLGPDTQVGTWPEFNTMIGGFFKFHWNDGQDITYKIDDPTSPLTKMFKDKPALVVVDETYTFGRETYSRKNLRVLTSIDYAKMTAEDKAKEQFPRADGDYALSWIRREGKGRVFYEAHGHNEKIYAMTPILEHVLAGVQYALGDLAADDSPSQK